MRSLRFSRARQDNRRRGELFRATSQLPVETRKAMLRAIDSETLIVGAYTDRRGRVCPLLAAHRRGARSNALEFAHAWDDFARARRPRPATTRELQILEAMLQESLAGPAEPAPPSRRASVLTHPPLKA